MSDQRPDGETNSLIDSDVSFDLTRKKPNNFIMLSAMTEHR